MQLNFGFFFLKDSTSPNYIFVQLPDVLPGQPARSKPESEQGVSESTQCKNSLSEFKEGHIGKIIVRKSGKTFLRLGNVELDLTVAAPSNYYQVSIHHQ